MSPDGMATCLCSIVENSLMTGIRAWEMDFGPLYISVDDYIFSSDKGLFQIDSLQSHYFQMIPPNPTRDSEWTCLKA